MSVLSKEPPLPPWGYALSGSVGAVLANVIVYPLDIAKTRLQTQPKRKRSSTNYLDEIEDPKYYKHTWDAICKIYKQNGIQGLYVGLPGTLVGVAATNFAYFYWYGLVRTAYSKRVTVISTSMELVLGAVAGALAQLFTLPIAVVTTAQQTHDGPAQSAAATAKRIIQHDGITGLWRGLKASLVLVINPSITYGSYQRLKVALFPGKSSFSPQESFLLGALSKAMATVATQPLIVAKVMVQASAGKAASKDAQHLNNFGSALWYLAEHEGLSGLFKGLGPQLGKGVIVQGLLFAFRDQVQLLIILLFRLARKRSA
ncbi:hypothetical protein CANCADRAFT_29676 [Tortispora caseinolytica NRRL Y-17796]|uniref:Mitochondrial carrier protein n=1 Tax=Tortispora caseinolytica NRRL Y-17796 TaxID=767744 RepID=A0A1E4T9F2_9ASCO|nr:hypothetical protein CANCADRAFT_29676 [Tortispora caseinolytica NRRL Y-17796]